MCTVSINIDDAAVRRINPSLTSRESIVQWLQRQVDELIEEMSVQSQSLSPNAHTAEEMKTIVAERLHLMETGEATYIDGEEGFAQIRMRYGL
jgi:shikimate kinase